MLEKLYALTGKLELGEVAKAIRKRGVICLSVQKYVAVGDGAFKRVWAEPAECVLKPNDLGNDLVRSDDGELVNITARVVEVAATRLLAEMKSFGGARELSGLSLNFYYDCEHEVGVVIEGYSGAKRRPVIPRVRLDVALSDDELVAQEVMRLKGIPEELQKSYDLLSEMSEP